MWRGSMAYALLRGGSLSKSPLEEAEVGGHMIKLVLCDMDGTLVPFGAERVSDRTLAAIRSLVHAGVRFGPASGREPIDLKTFFSGDESLYETGIASRRSRPTTPTAPSSPTYARGRRRACSSRASTRRRPSGS